MQSQSAYVEDLVASFRDDLTRIVAQARRDLMRQLTDKLAVVDGVVSKTRGNTRVLQRVDEMFQNALDKAGYQDAVKRYVMKFDGQFEFFQDTLDRLGKQIGKDLKLDFGKRDLALFTQQKVGAVKLIDAVVDTVASSAERQAMLAVGGMKLSALIDAIVEKVDTTVGQATTLADTALSTYYRTIQDRGFRIIERSLPEGVGLQYKYGGPSDVFVRPFCRLLLMETAAGATWTRAEIDDMDNGQLPNVFLTGGGYNCRHQWLVEAVTDPSGTTD